VLDFGLAVPEQRAGALTVWRRANIARGNPPSPARIVRIAEKLADAEACVVVGVQDGNVVAMALAEPVRERHGAGAVRPDAGHVSMVFVDPDYWGRGVGGALVDALHGLMRRRGWRVASLWTRSRNQRARRLYEGRGYRLTADVDELQTGDRTVRYEADLGGSVPAASASSWPPSGPWIGPEGNTTLWV
jgi:ribosomal protein S18 acetylase RimI-like enzyme